MNPAVIFAVIALHGLVWAKSETRKLLRHPLRENEPNAGLPDACLTYAERYNLAFDPKPTTHANAPQDHHKFAIVSWGLYHGQDLLPDLIASLKVLALEGHTAGYDVWLMYRVETGSMLTLEDYKQLFPPDLQDLLIIWDPEEVFALYDKIPGLPIFQKWMPGFWDYKSALGYIPGTWLMHRFAAYEFAYMLESDVRFTGDWGDFLTAALNVATAGEAPDWSQVAEGGVIPAIAALDLASTELPTSFAGLPDLLNFVPIIRSDKWADTAHNITEPKYESLLMMWGGSRRLFQAMHTWSRQGKAVYYESFMPTVAASEGLKMVAVQHPVWLSDQNEGHSTWHCCTLGARDVYEDWLKAKHCLHSALLHPVKLSEPIWRPNSFAKWVAA